MTGRDIHIAQVADALQTDMETAASFLREAEAIRKHVMCLICEQPVSEHTNQTVHYHTDGTHECQNARRTIT